MLGGAQRKLASFLTPACLSVTGLPDCLPNDCIVPPLGEISIFVISQLESSDDRAGKFFDRAGKFLSDQSWVLAVILVVDLFFIESTYFLKTYPSSQSYLKSPTPVKLT